MPKNVKNLFASALAIALMGACGVAWASSIFLKLANIPGESTNERHKNEIDIHSFSLGFVNELVLGRKIGAGTCGDMVLTKNIDRASPGLLAAVMAGKHINTGVLTFTVQSEGETQDYYVLTMNEIYVTAVRQLDSAGASSRVSEQVTMNARTYQFVYRVQQPDGSVVEQKFGWDCVRNSQI